MTGGGVLPLVRGSNWQSPAIQLAAAGGNQSAEKANGLHNRYSAKMALF